LEFVRNVEWIHVFILERRQLFIIDDSNGVDVLNEEKNTIFSDRSTVVQTVIPTWRRSLSITSRSSESECEEGLVSVGKNERIPKLQLQAIGVVVFDDFVPEH